MHASTHTGQAAPAAVTEPLPGSRPPRGSSVIRLLRFERRWLVRVFDAVLPGGEPALPVGAADVPLGRFVDDLVTRMPLLAVLGLRASLWLVMLSPVFVLRRPRTFLGLPPAERVALLDRLRRDDRYLVRESAVMFKLLGCLGFCGLGPIQRRVGIHPVDATWPDWVERQGRDGR